METLSKDSFICDPFLCLASLVAGDVEGRFKQLFIKVQNVLKKSGEFDVSLSDAVTMYPGPLRILFYAPPWNLTPILKPHTLPLETELVLF